MRVLNPEGVRSYRALVSSGAGADAYMNTTKAQWLVEGFQEKPETAMDWINGGFFILEPGVFDAVANVNGVLRDALLARIVEHDGLAAPFQNDRDTFTIERRKIGRRLITVGSFSTW